MESFSDYSASLRTYIGESLLSNQGSDSAFSDLALRLFRLQFSSNVLYRSLCEARGIAPRAVTNWREIPAVPAAAFKELSLSCLAPATGTVEFRSSGTTMRNRSRHIHNAESLALYEASLLPWFERHVLADVAKLVAEEVIVAPARLPMLFLTPERALAQDSSLVYMFDAVAREFGADDSLFVGRSQEGWIVDLDRAVFAIRKSTCANRPLVILGAAFNFVHLLEHFAANDMRYCLARGSRVIETGGYKGQAREIPKAELHALITKYLGIAPEYIVTEYGMCELSSQAYNPIAGESKEAGAFRFPPWARAQIISPETGLEVADGGKGLVRVIDLANVYSVLAVQTEDLGVRRGSGFELVGRAPQAAARGCSLLSK